MTTVFLSHQNKRSQMSNLKTKNYNSNVKSNIKYRSYTFSLSIIAFVSSFPNTKVFWIFQDQLLRSATSIGANIIEAIASSSKKDFAHYYQIALKSANETKYWLCLLRDAKLIDKVKIDKYLTEAIEIANMIAASLLTMRNKRI